MPRRTEARAWEEAGEQLRDWIETPIPSEECGTIEARVQRHVEDGDSTLLFARSDGWLARVGFTNLVRELTTRSEHARVHLRLSTMPLSSFAQPSIGHAVFDAYEQGNPFRATVSRR